MRMFPVLALFSMACGGFEPQAGTWDVSLGSVTEDTCGGIFEDAFEDPDPTAAALTLNDDGFTLTIENDPLDCTLDKMDFTCEPDVTVQDNDDLIVTTTLTFGGTFSDETNATGNVDIDFECVGADCADAEAIFGFTFPCDARVSAAFSLIE